MIQELDGLITEQVNYLHQSIDELNDILIEISKCQRSDQLNKIFSNIEKTEDQFNKDIIVLQNNIKNFIKRNKPKLTSSKNISYQQQSFSPILGIDLGTSNSTVGYYRLNSRNLGEMDIVANLDGSRSIPSVVCIVDNKISVGKEAIKLSQKYPKNFIYDSKRMLGKKYDDPIIQDLRKNWTFETVPSEDGDILIQVPSKEGDKYYYPYQISGMVLTELMNLANSQLSDQTNQAIITVPAYFTKEQIEDTKRAAKYAKIELIKLLKEPLAATFCYGYKTNDLQSYNRTRDILIYDFGGGTLDVSYVEVKGSNFNVLSTAGDSDLGGQDFTNCIFELIQPQLDLICKPGWKSKSQFVNKVKKYCEDAKIKLSSVEEYELYFDVPKDIGIERDTIFEQVITREVFKQITKQLFDRCMNPVMEVLYNVKRDPHKIESLVLVGGSSYLPMILEKLHELTGKDAYHGVSAVDAVSYGACVIAGQHIQKRLKEMSQLSTQIDRKDAYLLSMKVNDDNSFVTSRIGLVKYNNCQEYFEDVINEGNPIPFTKDNLIYNTEILIPPIDKTNIEIPIYIWLNETKKVIDHITYHVSETDNFAQKAPLLKIRLTQDESGIYYETRKPTARTYSPRTKVNFDVESLYGIKKNEPMNQGQAFESSGVNDLQNSSNSAVHNEPAYNEIPNNAVSGNAPPKNGAPGSKVTKNGVSGSKVTKNGAQSVRPTKNGAQSGKYAAGGATSNKFAASGKYPANGTMSGKHSASGVTSDKFAASGKHSASGATSDKFATNSASNSGTSSVQYSNYQVPSVRMTNNDISSNNTSNNRFADKEGLYDGNVDAGITQDDFINERVLNNEFGDNEMPNGVYMGSHQFADGEYLDTPIIPEIDTDENTFLEK